MTTAVARGDLSRKITVERERRDPRAQEHHQHDGGPAQRVRRRGHARRARGRHRRASSAARRRCPASAGTWKDLTDNVNFMASNLTAQVRNIAEVATAHRPRRPVEEDHGERERRDPAAQGNAQHDGGPAERVRLRGDARGPRGGHRRPARRAGGRCRVSQARGRTSPTT